jgi:Ca2+-binding EF-hand superfamily protein
VKTNAKVNLDEGSRMLAELKEENERLQAELSGMAGGGNGSITKRIASSFKANREQIKQMFEIIDSDKSGEVSYEEFAEFLTESKSSKKLGEFAEVLSLMMMEDNPFAAIDTDGSGQISWEEFEAWIHEQEHKEVDPQIEIERLRQLINTRNGVIESIEMTPEKLAEISAEREKAVRTELELASSKELERLKLEILTMRKQYRVKGDIRTAFEKNRGQVEKLFFSLDKDGSGEVSHEEFKEFLAHAEGLGEFGDMMRKLTLLENPFEELDIDGDGTLSWEEFLIWVQSQTAPRQKKGPTNEELQAQLKDKQRSCKEARELAQQRKGISQGLETRVRELMKRVQSIQEKMQQANLEHKKKVSQWEEQAKMFMQANKRKMSNIDKHDMTWWNKDEAKT